MRYQDERYRLYQVWSNVIHQGLPKFFEHYILFQDGKQGDSRYQVDVQKEEEDLLHPTKEAVDVRKYYPSLTLKAGVSDGRHLMAHQASPSIDYCYRVYLWRAQQQQPRLLRWQIQEAEAFHHCFLVVRLKIQEGVEHSMAFR